MRFNRSDHTARYRLANVGRTVSASMYSESVAECRRSRRKTLLYSKFRRQHNDQHRPHHKSLHSFLPKKAGMLHTQTSINKTLDATHISYKPSIWIVKNGIGPYEKYVSNGRMKADELASPPIPSHLGKCTAMVDRINTVLARCDLAQACMTPAAYDAADRSTCQSTHHQIPQNSRRAAPNPL